MCYWWTATSHDPCLFQTLTVIRSRTVVRGKSALVKNLMNFVSPEQDFFIDLDRAPAVSKLSVISGKYEKAIFKEIFSIVYVGIQTEKDRHKKLYVFSQPMYIERIGNM